MNDVMYVVEVRIIWMDQAVGILVKQLNIIVTSLLLNNLSKKIFPQCRNLESGIIPVSSELKR